MASTMVVGVDGTADSLGALSKAADLGQEAGAALVVMLVRHESTLTASSAEAGAVKALGDTLDELERLTRERVQDVLAGRKVAWQFEVGCGDPAGALIAAARAHGATTIVVGGRSHGLVGGLVIGSVAQKLVRHSPISVLVVRDGDARRLEVASTGERR
jgi:nucleotide-binding universal stress UspA family protein